MKNRVNSRRGAGFLAFMICFGLLYLVLTPVQHSEAAPPSPPSLVELEQVDLDKEPLKDVDPDLLKGLVQQDEDALLGTYIVQLQDAPLATYRGGVPGLRATRPAAGQKLDARSLQSRAYMTYLDQQRALAINEINQELGRSIEVLYEYKATLNGLATKMTPQEAINVAQLPRVKFVEREVMRQIQTDAGPSWLGAEGIWDGTDTGGVPGTKGEGVVVGVIDTGIDPWNPSFSATGGDGYAHNNPLGSGTYLGVCDPNNTSPPAGVVAYDPTFPCNDKLIGVWGYTSSDASPRDTDGHGSHTAGTSAGNVVIDSVVEAPTDSYTATISGVAPHANIIMYDGCSDDGGCPGAALQAARDQALLDGVDVINYSIGGGVTADPWTDTEAQSWLALRDAGIFVATSAGNSGPDDATLGAPADLPWMTSVGANSHNRAFLSTVTISDGVTASITLAGQALTSGYGPATVVFAKDFVVGDATADDARLCAADAFPAGTFNGEIVVCERGLYGRVAKGQSAFDGGAGGFILAQPDEFGGGPGAVSPDTHVLPAIHIDYYEYQTLLNYVASASGPITGTISGASLDIDDAHGDIMASFSSRGPNSSPPLGDIVVPKVTAPGRAIWAAYKQGPGGDEDFTYNVIQGTSMSSPHVAGAGALMKALHPSWTPAEIESALMTTARNSVLNDDGTNTATPFAQGSGHVDLSQAGKAGLVLDVTTAEFQAANPASGGDPKTLNLSSMGNDQCAGSCGWTRTVKSTQSSAVTWDVTTSGGMTLTVTPNNFSLAAAATQELNITADVDGLSLDQWVFGQITLTPSDASLPVAHMPVAVYVAAIRPEIEVNPSLFSSPQLPDVQVTDTLTINNPGTSDLNWTIEEAPGRAPQGVTSTITIWDQPVNGTSGIVSDFYSENNSGTYSGDDFTLEFDTQVSQIFAPGFLNNSDLSNATKLSWYIYPDASGQPAGHPEDGAGSEVWSFSALPTAAGVDITDNNITLDLIAAGAPTLNLTAETYWLVVFPDIDVATYGRWSWAQGTPRGAEARLNDVANNFNSASVGWGRLGTDFGLSFNNLAFRLSGVVSTKCDAPSDVSWLSVASTSGSTPVESSTPVDVLFDSTGLATGTYSATLCINSNDTTDPQIPVPVIMDVDPTLRGIIDVDPVRLSNAQETNNVLNTALTINNLGSLDLDWTIQETTARAPSVLTSTITFWDQPANGTSGILSTFYTNTNGGTYSADDFVVSSNTQVDEIFADGFMTIGSLSDAVKISWYIYPDASGQPAGHPEDGGGNEVWTFSALPTGAGVDITNNDITLDLTAAGAPALNLAPGTYWLVVFPDIDVATYSRWNWNQGAQQGAEARLNDPGNNVGIAAFGSVRLSSDLGLSFTDLAFRLSGTVESSCDVPSDLPWLTVGPNSGTTTANGSSSVNVLFDSTGLATGSYNGTLCVNSNDTTTPVVPVPVTLDVVPTVPALACNNGPATFDFGTPGNWSVVDNEGNGVVWTTIVASGETGNYTGGSGNAATVSSDAAGAVEFDSELRSPLLDLSGVTIITLDYLANYQNVAALDFLDLDITTDGGTTWTTLLSWNEDHGSLQSTPGEAVSVDLSPYAGETSAMLRWRYYDPNTGDWDWYAQIDDVSLTCSTAPLINVDPVDVNSVHNHIIVQSTETFTISNPGTDALNWMIEEAAPLRANRQRIQPFKIDANAKQDAGRIQQQARTLSLRTSNRAPSAVLYDQTDNATTNGTNSQEYGAANAAASNQAADDFVVPAADKGWRIEQLFVSGFYRNNGGPTPAVNVYFYQDNSGMPGTELYSATVAPADDATGALTIDLPTPAVLEPGTYWVSVQADMDFGAGGQWYWLQRSVQSNSEFVWRNPGDAFGSGCTDWSTAASCDYDNSDLLFSLSGSPVEACDLPSDIPWISSVSPLTGTTPVSGASAIDVSFDSSGLAIGTYNGSLCLRSDAAFTPFVHVPLTMTVEPSNGIALLSDLADSGTVGSTVSYTVQMTNTGNVSDTINLEATGTWTTTLSPITVTLDAGESTTLTVDVEIPANASNGATDTATVTATSATDSSVSQSSTLTTTAIVPPSYGVTLSSDLANSGTVGSTVGYTVNMTNTGNVSDTINLEATGTWTTTVSPISVTLGAGESTTVMVNVEIPANAVNGATDTTTVTATSATDSSVSQSSTLTTTAIVPLSPVYGVVLSSDMANSGTVGSTVSYTVNMTNTGNLSDTINLEATGTWTSAVSPISVTLGAGESTTVMVNVEIPANAVNGATDTTTVTATSATDSSVSDSSSLTTTAIVPVSPVYGVVLSSDMANSGTVGTTVQYTVNITNIGNTTDNFDLEVTGNWNAIVRPNSFGLGAGESATVTVNVEIPADASDGAIDVAIVTAISLDNSSVRDSTNLTTTAQLGEGDDGIDDETEAGAPNNGDGNGDGIPDNEQDNVASLPNQGSGDNQGYVTLAAPAGVQVVDVMAMPAPGELPEGVASLPQGMFEFNLNGLTSPTVVMTLTLHNNNTPINTYYKHDENSDTWYDFLFDGTTGAVITDDGQGHTLIALHFVDGGRGDADGIVNGVIDDPGAPAISMPPTSIKLTNLDGQTATDWPFALLATLSLALGLSWWYRRRK